MNTSQPDPASEAEMLIPSRMRPAPPSPLSEHELEELAHADIWSEARTLATVTLSAGMTPMARFRRVGVRELNSFVVPALGLVNILTLRGALMDFFHFQEDDGKIPDEIEHGDVASADPTTFGKSQPLLSAKRHPGGIDQEVSLVAAVCGYIRAAGDHSLLSENVRGKKVFDRLFDAMESFWYNQVEPNSKLVCRVNGAEKMADIDDNALALCAINGILHLPEVPGILHIHWAHRRNDLVSAMRNTLWSTTRGKFIRNPVNAPPLKIRKDPDFFPYGTALAVPTGLLSSDETARSLSATLEYLKNWGSDTRPGWVSQVAGIYAEAGFPGHAMDLLRDVAARALGNGSFPEKSPSEPSSAKNPTQRAAAGAFLHALKQLHPMVHAPVPAPAPAAKNPAFGYPSRMNYTFKKIQFDEKRETKRAPIEMPVKFVVKGLRPHQELTGVIRHPSTFGLGLQSTSLFPEGSTVELTAQCDALGGPAVCRLRGRVTWSRSKVGTRLFHGGVELDARSKDLSKWKAFILTHLRAQET